MATIQCLCYGSDCGTGPCISVTPLENSNLGKMPCRWALKGLLYIWTSGCAYVPTITACLEAWEKGFLVSKGCPMGPCYDPLLDAGGVLFNGPPILHNMVYRYIYIYIYTYIYTYMCAL